MDYEQEILNLRRRLDGLQNSLGEELGSIARRAAEAANQAQRATAERDALTTLVTAILAAAPNAEEIRRLVQLHLEERRFQAEDVDQIVAEAHALWERARDT